MVPRKFKNKLDRKDAVSRIPMRVSEKYLRNGSLSVLLVMLSLRNDVCAFTRLLVRFSLIYLSNDRFD